MIQTIKKHLVASATSIMLLLSILVPTFLSSAAYASTTAGGAGTNVANGLCSGINAATSSGVNSGSCSTSGANGSTTLEKIASTIVNIFSIIVGVAAVIMIVVGGFRYISSGGDSTKVGGAKNTLIYAIVGLIIVALAQAIVRFVLNHASQANSPT